MGNKQLGEINRSSHLFSVNPCSRIQIKIDSGTTGEQYTVSNKEYHPWAEQHILSNKKSELR